jgi:hypothetical protein
MSASSPQIENRQSFRFPSGDAIQGQLVLAGRRRWPISIVDQSASGFGVLTDSRPPLKCGDLVELRTDSFVCETRVAHVTEVERGRSGNEESQPPARFRIGLIRLRDISIKSDERKGDVRHPRLRHFFPKATQNPIALFAAAFLAVVVASATIGVLSSTDSAEQRGVNSRNNQLVSSEGPLNKRNSSSESVGTENRSTIPAKRNAQLDSTAVELRRLPGAVPFVMTGVVHELDLSDVQIERIHRIIDDTNEAIAKHDEMRRLLENARRDAIGVLTVQQRRQWESLSGGNRSATAPGTAAKSTAR